MTIQVFKLYIHKNVQDFGSGKISVMDFDISKSYNGKPANYILLGTVDQEIDVPEIDTNQLQIDALESCVQIERAESQSRVNILLDRISKLKAISHEPRASED
jgi:hypothetical protein